MVKLRRTDKRAQNNLKERGDWHQTFQEILRVARAYMQLRSDERRHPNPTADMAGTPGGTSERLFYEHAIRALGWQFNSGDALDAKTATWFTLVTVLLPLVAAILGGDLSCDCSIRRMLRASGIPDQDGRSLNLPRRSMTKPPSLWPMVTISPRFQSQRTKTCYGARRSCSTRQ